MKNKDTILEVNDVVKVYKGKRKTKVLAVNGVSFTVEHGRCIGLAGESGCGKSTLARMIAGLETPAHGDILWKGFPVRDITRKNPMRKEIQMVFQNSLDAVNRRTTAREIIAEPLRNFYHLSGAKLDERIDTLLLQVGMENSEKTKYPNQFSGGQLQRICIARMLASNPDLLILDEPLSSLDVSVQAQILNLFADLKKELDMTYLLISHDLEAVYYLADEIIIMYRGKIMEQIKDIKDFANLRHPYTKRLLMSSFSYRGKEVPECYREEVSETGCLYYARCPYADKVCGEYAPLLKEIGEGHFCACNRNCQ
ncbi:ATP-binding cassette domain-containing protein [Robinsoniella sp. KNHs210]|uniref:ATP-binding cassette domain-containing protein n=1 Tax=Robinsoniella sp. KNHs210 TaxID=1469950 RepID=UPI0004839EC0|nr:ABC transporter ATP-binding protein [Robinsoniella sp. KNHs210]